jgi:hypothetical protein
MTRAALAPIPTPLPQPTVLATEMLDLMIRLADLLAHETTLVRAGLVEDVPPLQKEKLRLVQLYQRTVKGLTTTNTKITGLPTPLRAQLVAASGRLAETVGDNERALRIGRAATRRVLDMVVESVKAKLKPVSRYNAKLTVARQAPALTVMIDRRM